MKKKLVNFYIEKNKNYFSFLFRLAKEKKIDRNYLIYAIEKTYDRYYPHIIAMNIINKELNNSKTKKSLLDKYINYIAPILKRDMLNFCETNPKYNILILKDIIYYTSIEEWIDIIKNRSIVKFLFINTNFEYKSLDIVNFFVKQKQ